MELDLYNIKEFQDGLEDILKNPWKKPVFIQDAIPTFPEENNDQDRIKHNLLKVFFIGKRLLTPYYSTISHLCLNKAYFLKYIIEKYSKQEDFVIMFQGTSRLTTQEIFEAFRGMSYNNISFLLDKVDCPISVYSKLKEALVSGDEAGFADTIDRCDLSSILPTLKYILFIKKQSHGMDDYSPQVNEKNEVDFETEKQKLLYRHEREMTERYGVPPNSEIKKDSTKALYYLLDLANDPDMFLDTLYTPIYHQYCQMKENGGLNESDIKAFEYIFHQPAFEKQYNENLKLWNDGTLKDIFTKRSKANSSAEEEPQSTPQIEDPSAQEEDFREATIEFKATELYNVIEELLNRIEGREHEFWDDDDNCTLNDIRAAFSNILTTDAGENINTQRAIIDELSGNKRVSPQSPYYYKGRLWLQPFFIILGHLYNKGVWKGDQLSFVKALFPDMHEESSVYGVVYKYDKQFIDTCRAKISLGNTNPPEKWDKWFEWIDTFI